ncbi:MAG: carboxylating nicotinate-nucleotide diphosphorylase [Armatimonadetes bacterium]|nr:carboxylating nicotinate-nucleotide diphosphorylase [Armatimonadota bacterium]
MSTDYTLWPVPPHVVRPIVAAAIAEDVGHGDITAAACIPADLRAEAVVLAKEPGVVSGLYVAGECFRQLADDVEWEPLMWEGDEFSRGDVLARVVGNARALLAGERVALNFLEHLCGIASLTREIVRAIEGTSCKLLDTRKTTPGLRALEKAAVRAGGGTNHRFALYDGFLIKDNHIVALGCLKRAVDACRAVAPPTGCIEVEVQDFDQLYAALEAGADVIMLDNFSLEDARRAVEIIGGRARIEISGGITVANAAAYASLGVDFISSGAITHSAPSINMSLEFVACNAQP